MAIRTLPIRSRQSPGLWKRTCSAARGVLDHARPVLRNLVAMPLSVLGYSAIDIGVFQLNIAAGWIVTGASLIWLEYLIADEED